MAAPNQVIMQYETLGMPPIKLDGFIYFVAEGTYSRTYSEKIITEKYTSSGEIDRQILNTGKHRWKMTLIVPLDANQVDQQVRDLGTVGDLDDLHTTADKMPAADLLDFWDISTNWDLSGIKTHVAYLKLSDEVPRKNDIGVWQIPIALWGYDYAAP